MHSGSLNCCAFSFYLKRFILLIRRIYSFISLWIVEKYYNYNIKSKQFIFPRKRKSYQHFISECHISVGIVFLRRKKNTNTHAIELKVSATRIVRFARDNFQLKKYHCTWAAYYSVHNQHFRYCTTLILLEIFISAFVNNRIGWQQAFSSSLNC